MKGKVPSCHMTLVDGQKMMGLHSQKKQLILLRLIMKMTHIFERTCDGYG